MKNLKEIVIVISFFILLLALGFGSFACTRWANWKLSYEDRVDQKIQQAMAEHIKQYHSGINEKLKIKEKQ